MCWECEDDTVCWYCGNECYGTCDDPDKCPTCWPLGPVDILEAEFDEAESCLGDVCDCECHKIIREADILLDNELDLPEHPSNVHAIEGIFPFLSLPGEIREKIYGLVFAQKGNQRFGQYHRGHIHTALLQTCRQINQEARHLPLKFNQISFPSPYQAVEFVGFKLKPRMYDLITKIHIEYHMYQDLHHAWCTLIPVLEKMKITHLALTIKGPVTENYIKGHTCTTERFKGMKHLKTVKVEIPSAILTAKTKTECIEYITKKLIKAPDPNVKKGKKRAAAEDAQQKLTKWVKCSPDKVTLNTPLLRIMTKESYRRLQNPNSNVNLYAYSMHSLPRLMSPSECRKTHYCRPCFSSITH